MKKIILIVGVAAIILAACEKNLPEKEGTSAQVLANEWWVTFTKGGADIYSIGTFKLLTYNSSANSDSIWVDDQKHSWEFKTKAKADYANLTFSTTNSKDLYHGVNVKITEGKVLKGVAKSRTGNITDSIYMKVEFSDDAGVTYVISGHGRTKFAEDDY